MDSNHFRIYVIRPTLQNLGMWSESAELLLLGTALKESGGLHYLKQLGGGPALGVYQIEPATHADVWENYLQWRPPLHVKVMSYLAPEPEREKQLITNLAYATVMARIIYFRIPKKLPKPNDYTGLGKYWKKYYNTPLGKGTVVDFVDYLTEATK